MLKAEKSKPLTAEQRASIKRVGTYLLIVAIVVIGATIYVWPSAYVEQGSVVAANFTVADNATVRLHGGPVALHYQTVVLLLGVLGGAIGGLCYSMKYLAQYAGNAEYSSNWEIWYVSHPIVGAMLGLAALGVLKGASAVVEAFGNLEIPSAPLALFGVGVLAGVAQWSVIRWFDKRASSLFGGKEAEEKGKDEGGSAKEKPRRVEIEDEARERGADLVSMRDET